MSQIYFNKGWIYINGEVDFNEIYKAIDNEDIVFKKDNYYRINANLIIGNKSKSILKSKNEVIDFLGNYFQIQKNSKLVLGEIDYKTYAVKNGSVLNMPNIELKYGFGSREYNSNTQSVNSGDLFAYGSKINAWGFWAFFSGKTQKVELISCQINGFGRIEGKETILYNNLFEKSHGKYGILSPKGKIKVNKNNIVLSSIEYKNFKSCLYFNPRITTEMIIEGGIYNGYDNLFYVEKNPHNKIAKAILINPEIRGSFDSYFKDDKSLIEIYYTANINTVDEEGKCIPNAKIKIQNKEYITDLNGKCKIDLLFLRQSKNNTEIYKEYIIEVLYENHKSTYIIETKFYNNLIFKICKTEKYQEIIKRLDNIEKKLNTTWKIII